MGTSWRRFGRGFGQGRAAASSGATFSVTTSAPGQTLTINSLGVSAAMTVTWGDTQSDSYTGTALRTHVYASAGTYTVTLTNPALVTAFDLRDTKVTIAGTQISKLVNLTTLYLQSLSGLTWTVGASAPMPTGLTYLYLNTLSGVTGNLSAFTISANATDLHCISTSVTGDGFPTLNKLTAIELQWNGWLQATVDTVLLAIYSHFGTRSVAGGTLSIGDSNQAPTGAYSAQCPPTQGKNAAYELVNDSCAVNPTHKWTTVTFTA